MLVVWWVWVPYRVSGLMVTEACPVLSRWRVQLAPSTLTAGVLQLRVRERRGYMDVENEEKVGWMRKFPLSWWEFCYFNRTDNRLDNNQDFKQSSMSLRKPPPPPFLLLPQQQTNLIPGLNLNALGIFSTGLSVLPPAAGHRGGVPTVAPAGYNPFLVSTALDTALSS